MHFHGPSAEDRKGDTKFIVEQPQSNCLALNLLLFTLQLIQFQQTLAAAGTNRAAAAAADEEDGEDGEGSLESVAAFSKTEEQEDRKALLCLSCRE